jgi:hypothetical protein
VKVIDLTIVDASTGTLPHAQFLDKLAGRLAGGTLFGPGNNNPPFRTRRM